MVFVAWAIFAGQKGKLLITRIPASAALLAGKNRTIGFEVRKKLLPGITGTRSRIGQPNEQR